jgi:hypothetical protein
MPRTSWLDEDTDLPNLDDRVAALDHFTAALADGVVELHELEAQQARVADAIRAVEPLLDDALHAQITALLVEMTALNVMTTLHELASERVRATFAEPPSETP